MRSELETAVYLAPRDDSISESGLARLLAPEGERPAYARLYFGSETCEHALPSLAQLRRIVDFCRDRALPFTLMTPVCTGRGLASVELLLGALGEGDEVVFNDWGCFQLVRGADFVPVHGRLLNRATRDPRLDPAEFPEYVVSHLRSSVLNDGNYHEFLRRNGVTRVEMDNVRQGLAPPPDDCLPVSLYLPWVHVSLSRYCAGEFADHCVGGGGACPSNLTDTEGAPTLAWGSATYYRRDEIASWIMDWPVSRLVHQVGPDGLEEFLARGGVAAPGP